MPWAVLPGGAPSTSPAFTSPMRGCDLFTLNDAAQITRLEIIDTNAPPTDH